MRNFFSNSQDTIYAFSTAMVKSGVAVMRISGGKALEIAHLLNIKTKPEPRKAILVNLVSPVDNNIIDKGLVLYFPAPHSFTGEDIIEFHLHGSRAVMQHMLSSLENIPGVRLAEPGEFSQRAFLNNKMDLTQAEGLSDLINADTIMQKKQAFQQMEGLLKDLYERWRLDLIKIMSLFEAYIDFPEEEIPDDVINEAEGKIKILLADLSDHLNDGNKGEILQNGVKIALLGSPNVGKSSLLNYLAKRDVAIVSDIKGTTRDTIEVNLDLNSVPVTIADTAGIRESSDIIEKEGIKRSIKKAENANMKIILFDGTEIDAAIESIIDEKSIIVFNKIDQKYSISSKFKDSKYFPISIKDNIGLDDLIRHISKQAFDLCNHDETPIITRNRYRQELLNAKNILAEINFKDELEIIAENLRSTAYHIGKITGYIDVEEILGEIFSNFCIGK